MRRCFQRSPLDSLTELSASANAIPGSFVLFHPINTRAYGFRALTVLNSVTAILIAHVMVPVTIWIFWFRLAAYSILSYIPLVTLTASIVLSCWQITWVEHFILRCV